MRGLGWLTLEVNEAATELLNDARLLGHLAETTDRRSFGITGDPLSPMLDYVWQGCAAAPFEHFSPIESYSIASAPWINPENPVSAQFLGFFVEEWEGLPIDYERTINQRAWSFGGANFTPFRARHLAMEYTIALVATNEAGLDYGIEWLTEQLRGCEDCREARLILFPADPADVDPDPLACLEYGYWTVDNPQLLDVPRWTESPVPRLNCVLRRATFTVGSQDPHLYKCPTICLNPTEFTPPAEAGAGCYTWEQMFCLDDLDNLLSCDPPVRIYPNASVGVVVTIGASGGDGAGVFVITGGSGSDGLIRTAEIPQSTDLRIDGARHRIEKQGPADDGWVDGSSLLFTRDGDGGIRWPEFCSFTEDIAVGFWRVCNLENLTVQIELVWRRN